MQTIGQYQIDVYRDETFDKGSADNVHQYDHVYFDASGYVFPTMIGIRVFKNDALFASAIIGSVGGGTGVYPNSCIYEDTRLLSCCSDSVFCLSIPDLKLQWQTKADWAACFQLFKYEDNYIVHGEVEISRLDKDGNILWQQSGADIFVTLDGGPNFEMTDEFILVKDFNGKKYTFDYDGRYLG